jgi:hypothetical protein
MRIFSAEVYSKAEFLCPLLGEMNIRKNRAQISRELPFSLPDFSQYALCVRATRFAEINFQNCREVIR